MRSAVAIIGVLCCCASWANAFVVLTGRPSGISKTNAVSLEVRRASLRRTAARRPSMMSSVATPPIASAAAAPERKPKVQAIGSSDEYTNAIAQHEDKMVVVKFYDQFCRACDEIRPRYEALSHSSSDEDAVFFELEFSGAKDLCKQLGIRRLPTVHIYDGAAGRVADLPAGPSRFSSVEERFAEVASSRSGGESAAAMAE